MTGKWRVLTPDDEIHAEARHRYWHDAEFHARVKRAEFVLRNYDSDFARVRFTAAVALVLAERDPATGLPAPASMPSRSSG